MGLMYNNFASVMRRLRDILKVRLRLSICKQIDKFVCCIKLASAKK